MWTTTTTSASSRPRSRRPHHVIPPHGPSSVEGQEDPVEKKVREQRRHVFRPTTLVALLLLLLLLLLIAWCRWTWSQSPPERSAFAKKANQQLDDDDDKFWYLSRNSTVGNDSSNNNKVVYVGMFGLGHRLSKLAGAYHLVQQRYWPVSQLEVVWGACEVNGTDVFAKLFGHGALRVEDRPTTTTTVSSSLTSHVQTKLNARKSLVIRNDVVGYYAGQVFKNAQIPLSQLPTKLWRDKLQTDARLFQHLLMSFQRQPHGALLTRFQQQHQWSQHWVLALHVRLGNGEQAHFAQAQRQVDDPTTVLHNLAHTLTQLVASRPQNNKPPLVFVATDTPDVVVKLLQRLLPSWPVVSVPQPTPQKGVSYSAWTTGSPHCWTGWLYSMVDMALLSQANVLVAAQRSTFSQILPRSILLDRSDKDGDNNDKWYCEADPTGKGLQCFNSTNDWLFRTPGHSQSYGIGSPPHKVMVHFPDVMFGNNMSTINDPHSKHQDDTDDELYWWNQARDFFKPSQTSNLRLLYGFKIAKKYRRFQTFRPDWTTAAVVKDEE